MTFWTNIMTRITRRWKCMTTWWKNVGLMLDAPRLHMRIAELERQLEIAQAASNTAPTFYEIAKPIDAEFLSAALREKVVEDMTPLLTERALEQLRTIMLHVPSDMRKAIGRIAALDEQCDFIQVEVRIPELRHTIAIPSTSPYHKYDGAV